MHVLVSSHWNKCPQNLAPQSPVKFDFTYSMPDEKNNKFARIFTALFTHKHTQFLSLTYYNEMGGGEERKDKKKKIKVS